MIITNIKEFGTHLTRVDSSGTPIISVGIMSAPTLDYALFDGGFELKNVTIGVGFHWQRNENQRFLGTLRLEPDEAVPGNKLAINDINVEDYLKSVISSEMSATASESLLKAHAIISRSWLLRQIADRGKHASAESMRKTVVVVDGEEVEEITKWYDREDHTQFDVCADDHCQRYQGITRQTSEAVSRAVDYTRGMVLTFENEICDARFSKCCGGVTELFENCWEDMHLPYLESIDDVGVETLDGVSFCDTSDSRILSQVLNNYDQETTDFYSWRVKYDIATLSDLIRRKSGIDFGDIIELRPLHRGPSGRITRLLIVGTKRKMVVGKELEIRRWLSESHLYSSAFDVDRIGDEFVLSGRGWGHGVGLCQIGAAVMGSKGYSHEQILQHYFPKAQLCRLY